MILVVGSVNIDIFVQVKRLPKRGETLLGSDYAIHPGGKGGNQSVAAARAGGQVRLVAKTGIDEFADNLLDHLAAEGVDIHAVLRGSRPSGAEDSRMFNKLVASGGRRGGSWSPRTILVSVGVHGILLAGAVYASVAAPEEQAEAEELVTFIEIPEEAPPTPEAPPPPPPPEAQPAATPPPPQGFQELIPPIEPPSVIPDVDNSLPAVNPEDFSGIGQAGGVAEGVEGGTPQPIAAVDSSTFAYETNVLSRQPELRNLSQVRSYMERSYPRTLQDAGIGGNVILQFVVEPDGTVDRTSVTVIESSHEQFAGVSKQVAERFRFRPGVYQDREVRVLVRMPISWQPAR